MRVGVVGLGHWGSKHCRVLSGLGSVTSVVGVDEMSTRRAAMEDAYPGLVTTSTLDEAVPLVDAAVIATPPETHYALARQLMQAGKHVLVEKPLTMNVEEGRELIALAKTRGVQLMVGHTFVYNGAVEMLRNLISQGELGEVLYIDSKRVNLGLYQTHANVIWDLAPHDISIMNELLGAPPESVLARGQSHAGTSVIDNAYLHLNYGSTQATVHVSWLNPRKIREITVVGSKKMAIYDDLADEQRIRVYDKGLGSAHDRGEGELPMSYRYGDIVAPYVDFVEPLAVEDTHFVDCIAKGAIPRSSGEHGLDVVKVLQACDRSLASGTEVSMVDLDTATVDLRDRAYAQ